MILTSNRSFAEWAEVFGDQVRPSITPVVFWVFRSFWGVAGVLSVVRVVGFTASGLAARPLAPIEHVFAFQKNVAGLFVRTVGLASAQFKIGLADILHNINRLAWIRKAEHTGLDALSALRFLCGYGLPSACPEASCDGCG